MASPWFEFPTHRAAVVTPRAPARCGSASSAFPMGRRRSLHLPLLGRLAAAGGGSRRHPASRTRDAARRTVDALHGAAHRRAVGRDDPPSGPSLRLLRPQHGGADRLRACPRPAQAPAAQPDLLFLSGQDGPREKPPLIRHTPCRTRSSSRSCATARAPPTRCCKSGSPGNPAAPHPFRRGDLRDLRLRAATAARCPHRDLRGHRRPVCHGTGLAAWHRETRGGFHHYAPLSGGHFFLHAEEEALARHINEELGRLLYEPACSAQG